MSLKEKTLLIDDSSAAVLDLASPVPLVRRALAAQWPACAWTLRDWTRTLGPQTRIPVRRCATTSRLRCGCSSGDRQVRHGSRGTRHEAELAVQQQSLRVLADALESELARDVWLYAAYLRAHELVASSSAPQSARADVAAALPFAELGVRNVTLDDVTLWFGSAGARSPEHRDAYGSNVVVQLVRPSLRRRGQGCVCVCVCVCVCLCTYCD